MSCSRLTSAMVLAALGSACHPLDTIAARRIARDANAAYRALDYPGAIAKYREALALDPATPNANLNLGYALFSIYNPEATDDTERLAAAEAITAFERHLEATPDDARAKIFRIKILLRAAPHDPAIADKAFAHFSELLAQNPLDRELRQYMVSLFIDCKRYKQAVEYFTADLKTNPDDIETMKALAIIADKSGEPFEALRWYRQRAEIVNEPAQKAVLFYELGTYAWNMLHYQPDRMLGVEGLRFSDLGIEACNRARALNDPYPEAMVYANLLYLKRALFEPTSEGKYIDQMLAYDLRAKAAALMGPRAPVAAAATAAQQEPAPTAE
jgi:tetratricopeptide (TPR) repeat protein